MTRRGTRGAAEQSPTPATAKTATRQTSAAETTASAGKGKTTTRKKATTKPATRSGAQRSVKPETPAGLNLDHDAIARRAYAIWESSGRPHGDHDAHWHEAVEQLRREQHA